MELTSSSSSPVQRRPLHLLSVLQLVLSALAIAFLWSSAPTLVLIGLVSVLTQDPTSDTISMFLLAAALISGGLLLLPSAYYALRRLQGKPAVDSRILVDKLLPRLWPILLVCTLLIGYLIQSTPPLNWLLLPFLHVIAAGLPVGWLLYITIRQLPLGSSQRMWGAFTSGMVLAPTIVFILEALAALGFLLVGVVYLASQPELVQKLIAMAEWMQMQEPSVEQIVERYGQQFIRTEVVVSVMLFVALVVPLIEEIFKPAGVWLLAGNRLSPVAGFVAGALSGAGFALFESLMLTSSGQEWTSLMIARIGTSAVHIITAAITGWALTYTLRTGNYLKLGLAYLLAVMLHAIWNGLTVLTAFTTLSAVNNWPLAMPSIMIEIGKLAPGILVFLAIASFLALLWTNRALAHSLLAVPQPSPTDSPTGDPPPEQVQESML